MGFIIPPRRTEVKQPVYGEHISRNEQKLKERQEFAQRVKELQALQTALNKPIKFQEPQFGLGEPTSEDIEAQQAQREANAKAVDEIAQMKAQSQAKTEE